MNPLLRKIEGLANVCIIVVAIIVCIAAVKYFRTKAPGTSAAPSSIAAGTKINLPAEDWAKNRQTLLLALSTNCKYCSASAEFYQRVVQAASANTKLVAVLPQSREESQQYITGLKLGVEDIQQVSPSSLGVKATPTLILVNSTGTVTSSWVGLLPHEKEEEVLAAIR